MGTEFEVPLRAEVMKFKDPHHQCAIPAPQLPRLELEGFGRASCKVLFNSGSIRQSCALQPITCEFDNNDTVISAMSPQVGLVLFLITQAALDMRKSGTCFSAK